MYVHGEDSVAVVGANKINVIFFTEEIFINFYFKKKYTINKSKFAYYFFYKPCIKTRKI